MVSFKSLLGVVPRGARTVRKVVSAGISFKKEDRSTLSTSDKLKLDKAAREGGNDKLTFFETNGKAGGNFRAVYDLHMRLDTLSTAMI